MTESPEPGAARRSIAEAVEGTSGTDFSLADWSKLALTAVIFGSAFLWIAIALRSLSPGLVAFGRAGLGALTVALIPAAYSLVRREDWSRLLVASFLGFALPVSLVTLAEVQIPSAVAGMLICTLPIATAVVAAIETRTLPRRGRLIGLTVGLIGIGLLVAPNLSGLGGEALGVLMVVVSNISVATATTFVAPLQQTYGSLRATMWLLIVSTGLLLPFGVLGLRGSSVQWSSLGALVVLGVVGTGVVWVLFVGLVGRVGAVRAGVIGYVMPIVALGLGVVVLNEQVEPVQLAGVVVALLGGYLVSRGGGGRVTAELGLTAAEDG